MPLSENIRWFADIALKDRPRVGGKGGSLGELARAGIGVPPGFVVCTSAFERFLGALDSEDPIRPYVESLDDLDLEAMTDTSKKLRARLEKTPLPMDVQADFLKAHAELCGGDPDLPVAVRSSATCEDAEDASFAGLQDTYLWVTGAGATLQSVRSCWASLYSVPSIAYRRKHHLPEAGVAMAVVIQRMVNARAAGVMFTRSPLTGDRSVITIEGAWGLGSAVVSGEVTPDRFVISKITGEISARNISEKHIQHLPASGGGIQEAQVPQELRQTPCLRDEEIVALKNIGCVVERLYGRPQDIEWAVDGSGGVSLLQSRPETVWSAREQAPVVRPVENPLQHVMRIFRGTR
jgi:pyruvate, water dikinase